MSLASILLYSGMAFVCMAFILLMIGAGRMRWAYAQRSSNRKMSAEDLLRLKTVRRADWRSAASLLCIALVAFALTLNGSGPFFTEPSGNIAGGLLLVAGIVALILAIVLGIRHVALSRALRSLDNSVD